MDPVVCRKCKRALVPLKNGIPVVEVADFGPYKLYEADVWECPNCHVEIVTGFSQNPKQHFEYSFPAELNRAQARPGYLEFT